MSMTYRRRALLAACCAALAALTLTAAGATAATASGAAAASRVHVAPIVTSGDGAVRGTTAGIVNEFLGIPYAAPPTGDLRWRPPQPPADWRGVRDATQFGPSCPQPPSPFAPPGPFSEDCLYLNVYTPSRDADHRLLRGGDEDGLPVLVWIHGGGLTEDAGRNYDGSKLAADGTVVVTINYRLGALGFLAHPALASRPGGSAGNYGLMDQQAALRWVRDNIRHFGGDPHNVTIAGESAGGLSVLAQMVSPGSRGLFQKAIIQSGSFALNQRPLADAEAAGEAFAAQAGCPDQTAACLRQLPVSDLVNPNFVEIPGVVDGKVLTEPIGAALAAGQFARVPVLNGTNHDEERIFVTIGLTVSQGTDVPIPEQPVTTGNYQTDIAAALGVPAARAAAIAAEYPPAAYPSPAVAFSTLVGDASFACPALQIDQLTSQRVPTYAYEFNDDNAPPVFSGPIIPPPVATHASELQYLFDLPNAPVPTPLSAGQQALAASMRAAWANFAARGNPATRAVPWPAFGGGHSTQMLSLVPPQPQPETDFSARHHCAFWAAG
jgi:para-nitrobenzyl esterase